MQERVEIIQEGNADGYDVVLRQRYSDGPVVEELIINGVFAMDSAQVDSEIALAATFGDNPGNILVGGLGLGYTAFELLRRGASHIDVVEISRDLVEWAHQGATPTLAAVANDPRVTIHHNDITSILRSQPMLPGMMGPWDGICLDIDNGPSFLIHHQNADLYTPHGIEQALRHVKVGGRLAVWSQGPSKEFWYDMTALDPGATERLIEVERGNRRIDYAIYSLRRQG